MKNDFEENGRNKAFLHSDDSGDENEKKKMTLDQKFDTLFGIPTKTGEFRENSDENQETSFAIEHNDKFSADSGKVFNKNILE